MQGCCCLCRVGRNDKREKYTRAGHRSVELCEKRRWGSYSRTGTEIGRVRCGTFLVDELRGGSEARRRAPANVNNGAKELLRIEGNEVRALYGHCSSECPFFRLRLSCSVLILELNEAGYKGVILPIRAAISCSSSIWNFCSAFDSENPVIRKFSAYSMYIL